MKYLNPYRLAINLRNYLFEKDKISSVKYPMPVISVGNLTTGGTGKTPVVIELVNLLTGSFNKKNILVIAKSYRAKLKTPRVVTEDATKNPQLFGDEACLIKQLCPKAHVWSGPNKSETLQHALLHYQNRGIEIDAVIVDDGFSHRKIKRDLDIVLIDVSQPLSHYRLLPLGHLREDIDSLARTQLVILTKVNSADPKTYEWFKNYLKLKDITAIELQTLSTIDSAKKEVFLFTAIGNPSQLKKQLNSSGFHIVSEKTYRDHHQYSDKDQLQIIEAAKEFPAAAIITTAKDMIKLTHPELKNTVNIITLKVIISPTDKGILNAKISSIFQ